MIGQAICIAGFLLLAVTSLFAVQYCFERDWMSPSVGFAFIAALFGVSALITLVMLGTQVWS